MISTMGPGAKDDLQRNDSEIPVDRSAIREELARVLASAQFEKAPALGRLLSFLVENDLGDSPQSLKETYIGHVLYGRSSDYDPKRDSVVRVNANRLRLRLEEYYRAQDGSRLRIDIPRGTYNPAYTTPNSISLTIPIAAESHSSMGDLPYQRRVLESGTGDPDSGKHPLDDIQKLVGDTAGTTKLRRAASHRLLLICSVCALVILLAWLVWRRPSSSGRWEATPFSRLSGQEEFSTFSPDGTHLAFTLTSPKHEDRDGIYIQSLNSDSPKQLSSGSITDTRPAWSPDGRQIAFIRNLGVGHKELRVLSVANNGTQRKIADLEGSYPWLCEIPRVSWSVDGKRLFTSAVTSFGAPCVVVEIDADTGVMHPLTHPGAGIGDLEASVAPNGRHIAFLRNTSTQIGDIYVMDVDGEHLRRITRDDRDIIGFCWDSTGEGLILASRRIDGVARLWHMTIASNRFQSISDGVTIPGFPSASADGRQISFTSYRNVSSIWRISADGPRRLISDNSSNSVPQTSPDGQRIVFTSDRTGASELWVSNRDGQSSHRLTSFRGGMVNDPSWSPDGKSIVFECRDRGYSDICLIASEGDSSVKHITSWSSNQTLPTWSRDGRTIYFTSNHSGRREIYSIPREGGEPRNVTHDGGARAVPLWTGGGLLVWRDAPTGGLHCVRTDGDGSTSECPTSNLPLPETNWDAWARWDAAPGGYWWVNDGSAASEIFRYDIAQRTERKIFSVPESFLGGDRVFSVEPDGKSALYVVREPRDADIDILQQTNK